MVLVCGRCLFCRWSGRLVDGLRVRWVSYHTEPGLQWRRYSDKPQFLLRCVAMVRLPFRTGSDSAVRKRVFQAESLKRFGERRALDLILMWTCPRKWRLWECRRVRWWVGSASLIGSFWWWCESCFIVDHAFNLAWVAILSLCIRFCSLDWLTIHLISDALQMFFFPVLVCFSVHSESEGACVCKLSVCVWFEVKIVPRIWSNSFWEVFGCL